ncbi:membrane protein insertase YidC [Rhodocaloribacter litoris]|uniref:membrane protein insertase YidC n=1 Tax=Rhodocaloribacter litoris TaxID=2558931 RepID=UPI001420EBA6|nr:membrane protein insertase YidC [Rhodocaloribacter litoris]QXD13726.1 membrane protein insertase YidC [Rhodocaloribacter litoris]GIV61031.1 MAG: membrane protein insertase YidC [Rhodothermaceae bacterium]
MDRNVVIATVLIALIMIVWLTWLTPPPPPPAGPAAGDSLVAVEPPPVEDEPPPRRRTPPVDSTIAGATEGEERFITVETDLYEARFSTKGATLVSFTLKKYRKAGSEDPVQLIDTTKTGALALVFTTPNNRVVDTRNFFFTPSIGGDRLEVHDGPATLSFRATVGEGAITQTYTFVPEEYEVQLSVEQEGAATFETSLGYELMWDGGIPHTEGDPEQEAQRAGAYARSGGEVEYIDLNSDAYQEATLRGQVDWVAVKNTYFTAVVIPDGTTRGAELLGERLGEPGTPSLREDYAVSLLMPFPETGADAFRLYIGPMEYLRLADYGLGLYDMVDYGWDAFEWMTRPLAKFVFIPLFALLGGVLPNYGLVIIVLALLVKLAVYPLTKSSYRSMARMRELQPKMEAIKEKYADNPQKQQEAMMKLYKETGVNPLGGCLPMLLQYPIIIALWQFLPQAIEIRQKGFLWAHDLSAPDAILHLPFSIPLYGDFVAGFTLLMGISMIVQMRIQMSSTPTNPQMKIFTYIFPVMIFAIFNRLSSGLSLYYLCYNVLTAIQQKFINRSLEKEKEAGAAANGKGDPQDARAVTRKGKGRRGKARSGKGGKKIRS